MDQNDGTTGGFIVGVIFAVIFTFSIVHLVESICQTENNVADCEWVSIPTEQEGAGQSVIYQR